MPEPLQDPVIVLLAGGQSRRMQGQDKALAEIDGQRMIDRVLARLARQAGTLWLSAAHDYATGLAVVRDEARAPAGPVGAIRSIASALRARGGDAFVTCPVDAPFVPDDLAARLMVEAPLAMAKADGALQPVFALWSARAVCFPDAGALMNVNTPQELEIARRHALDARGKRLGAAGSTRYSA